MLASAVQVRKGSGRFHRIYALIYIIRYIEYSRLAVLIKFTLLNATFAVAKSYFLIIQKVLGKQISESRKSFEDKHIYYQQ